MQYTYYVTIVGETLSEGLGIPFHYMHLSPTLYIVGDKVSSGYDGEFRPEYYQIIKMESKERGVYNILVV
jgi:hypothetical protein